MTDITINYDLAELRNELAPLYCRYDSQTQPQPGYLDLDGYEVKIGYNGEIGTAVPVRVWNGEIPRFNVSSSVRGDALADWLDDADNIARLKRIADCMADDDCDSDTIDEIIDEVQDSLDELDNANVWDVNEWLFGNNSLNHLYSDESSMDELVKKFEDEAKHEEIMLDGDVRDSIKDYAQMLDDDEIANLLPGLRTILMREGMIETDDI